LTIILIELFSAGGCPLKEASEHFFLSIKVLFWCCGIHRFVVPLLFFAVFLFSVIESTVIHCNISSYAIIIDLVPNIYVHLISFVIGINALLFPLPLLKNTIPQWILHIE
jgi:hypothetical protein